MSLRRRTYAPPAPKMPPGLVELMDGLARDVLKSNPDNIYEFCANHMRTLLDIRDGHAPKPFTTLDQKIAKAQKIVKTRGEQKRRAYDENLRSTSTNSIREVLSHSNVPSDAYISETKENQEINVDIEQKGEKNDDSCSEIRIEEEQYDTNVYTVVCDINKKEAKLDSHIDEEKIEVTDNVDTENQESMNNLNSEENLTNISTKEVQLTTENQNLNKNNNLSEADTIKESQCIVLETDTQYNGNDNVNNTIDVTQNTSLTQLPITNNTKENIEKTQENIEIMVQTENDKCVAQGDEETSKEIEIVSTTPREINDENLKNNDVDERFYQNDTISTKNSDEDNVEENILLNEIKSEDLIEPEKSQDDKILAIILSTKSSESEVEHNDECNNILRDSSLQQEKKENDSPRNNDDKNSTDKDIKDAFYTTETISADILKKDNISTKEIDISKEDNISTKEIDIEGCNVENIVTNEIQSESDAEVSNKPEKSQDDQILAIILSTKSSESNTESNNETSNVLLDKSEQEIKSILDSETFSEITDNKTHNINSAMDLETAAITIQKVFRSFLFKTKTASYDDPTTVDINLLSEDKEKEDIDPSIINLKEKRSLGITRMDTVLQTVNEEKSLSLSTDDSSTLSSAATIIQAHVRGFLVRNKLNLNKTTSTNSLIDSDAPSIPSLEADSENRKSKTVLNIHIVPEGGHFVSRDESILTSMDLSLDNSPPSSVNLHPLGYDKSERRKQLKREDAIQSVSPPSNNSGKLSDDLDSVKDVLVVGKNIGTEIPTENDKNNSNTVPDISVHEDTENDDSAIENSTTDAGSDELDVISPFVPVEEKSFRDSDNSSKLLHSGEFHDVIVPTNVTRSDTSVVREFQNVLVYFILWNN